MGQVDMNMNASAIRIGLGVLLAAVTLTACNSHPVSISTVAGVVERQERTSIEGTQAMDILWVIDNSGSMCQEQEVLRENFEAFISQIIETNLDFHIGITTTHMVPAYSLEPVAQSGLLQSTPQPIPGFDDTCRFAINAEGQIIPGQYDPVRAAVDQAVDCMANPPAAGEFDWSDAELNCALNNEPMGCTVSDINGNELCGPGNSCEADILFPDASRYRTIPKVLRSQDYRMTDGSINVQALQDDFACASLVGTRGFGIESGLLAAAEAVSPENTGGSVENPENASAPNHGLIRQDARFALIFVTDENDCSNPTARISMRSQELYGVEGRPDLPLDSKCGGEDLCEIVNREGYENSPLIPIEELKQQFIENLAETKGRELGSDFQENEVLVASIHGNSQRFSQNIRVEDCEDGQRYAQPSCASTSGIAYSGDRYERFLRTFPDDNFYPRPSESNPDAALAGEICRGDFTAALRAISEFLVRDGGGCITEPILPCDGPMDQSCPPVAYTNTQGSCELLPNTGVPGAGGTEVPAEYYCNSAIQVRAQITDPGPDTRQRLEATGYCVEGSIGDRTFPDGCVVSRDKYDWLACPSGAPGLKLDWTDGLVGATNALAGTTLQIRYNSVSSSAGEAPQ